MAELSGSPRSLRDFWFHLHPEDRISDEHRLHTMPSYHWNREVWDSDLVLVTLSPWIFKVLWLFLLEICCFSLSTNFSVCVLVQCHWSTNQSYFFCLHQITKALSVWVLSEVHEKQKHPPETHKEMWLVPPTSQWNLQEKWPFCIWG